MRDVPRQIVPNAATAAAWGDKPPAPILANDNPIVASNLRLVGKSTIRGKVDLTITPWRFVFRGCLWHSRDGKEWINLPSQEWTAPDGSKKYEALGRFTERDWHELFQAAALLAIHELVRRTGLEPRS
jgi:hypothetical protein